MIVRRLWSRFDRVRPWWLMASCLLAGLLLYGRFVMDRQRFSAQGVTSPGSTPDAFLTGGELYAKYCSVCHGADGDGRGSAARYLNPKARNLRTGSFRLVSTENRLPSWADVEAVLEHGIPGTSMRSYRELSQECRAKLVQEVFRLRRQGLREEVLRSLREEWPDVEPCAEDVEQLVDAQLAAGPIVAVPTFSSPSPEQLALGREVFLTFTCNTCHGDNATGDTDVRLVDEDGVPTRPRNLVAGELKGGREPASVYRRILLGIPGTPMPACRVLTETQRINLVHYCLSLSREPQTPSTNYTRAIATITRGSTAAGTRTPPGR